MKTCPACGSPINDNQKSCMICGSVIENDSETVENEIVINSDSADYINLNNEYSSDEIIIDADKDDGIIFDDSSDETVDEENAEDDILFHDFAETLAGFDTEETEKESFEDDIYGETPKPKPVEELSMAERIRKYQIIPDSQPIDNDDDFIPVLPKRERKETVNAPSVKRGKAVAPTKQGERAIAPTRIPVRHKRKINKGLIKILCSALVIVALAVTAVLLLSNESFKDKMSSMFSKEPEEQAQVNGSLEFKWVKGKKYKSDFDVLKIDKEKFRSAIEESLRNNCTSEYNTLKEHDFGQINNTTNYIGYIDNIGVGIIFELTEKDALIKNIYVLFDTSADTNKGETLISEYTACILNTLGEIKDLSYQNINTYASSIKINNFKSVATYTRYNDFIISKHLQGDYSALIINHGSESAFKKLEDSEILEIINCADEERLKEALTEPTVTEPEVTQFEEAVVYEVTTQGDPLRIRSGPGTDSDVLGTFENGTQIEVFGISDGWAKIVYNGETAWLSTDYLAEVE